MPIRDLASRCVRPLSWLHSDLSALTHLNALGWLQLAPVQTPYVSFDFPGGENG